MVIKHGSGKSKYGPGVDIDLTGDEVATAIDAYLAAHGVVVHGPRTIRIDGTCKHTPVRVYVDPSGFVINQDGEKLSGGVTRRLPAPPTPPTVEPRSEQGTVMSDNVIKHLATGTEALLEHMLPFMDDTLAKERLNTIVSSSDTTALRCFGIIYRTPVVVSDLFDQGFYRKFAVMDFARRIQKLLLELGDLFESMWASPMALPLAFIGGDRAMYLAYIRASGISTHAANARFGTTIPCMDEGALPHLTLDLTSVNGMALLEPVWSK